MSELKAFESERIYWAVEQVEREAGDIDNLHLDDNLFYIKSEADKVITEKDKEIADLKQKLENVQASMYADVVDANMENRILRRALWIARANRAIEKIAWYKLWNASISTMNPEDGARQEFDKWKKALGKFLKKAEEYK